MVPCCPPMTQLVTIYYRPQLIRIDRNSACRSVSRVESGRIGSCRSIWKFIRATLAYQSSMNSWRCHRSSGRSCTSSTKFPMMNCIRSSLSHRLVASIQFRSPHSQLPLYISHPGIRLLQPKHFTTIVISIITALRGSESPVNSRSSERRGKPVYDWKTAICTHQYARIECIVCQDIYYPTGDLNLFVFTIYTSSLYRFIDSSGNKTRTTTGIVHFEYIFYALFLSLL